MIIKKICVILMTAARSLSFALPRAFALSLVLLLELPLVTSAQSAGREIYPAPEQAAPDLAAGLKLAAAQHRRILLDFGGNWCTDCQVLDLYFHDENNEPILDSSYVLVHVNIGKLDQNLDIAARYEIPLNKGVPALAILDSRGKLLYSQKTGEFEAMRRMQSSSVTDFLNHWKPGGTT